MDTETPLAIQAKEFRYNISKDLLKIYLNPRRLSLVGIVNSKKIFPI
jgi:hypothetical protein